jgi:RNA polymerase sigma factor (sigma-70 family)
MSSDTPPAAPDRSELGRRSYQEGHSFEERAADLYRLLRYDVEQGRLFSGRQVDLFLTRRLGDITLLRAVECKAGMVKAEHIDEFSIKLQLVRREYPDALGTIISLASFTDAVRTHAAAVGIQLTLYRDLAAQLLDGHAYAQNLLREIGSSERYPVKMFIEPLIGYDVSGADVHAFKAVDEWLKDGEWNQLTLLGDVGTGKSFLSKMIARRLAKHYLDKPLENPLPILIDLRNADRQFSLEGLILTHFARVGLSQVSFEVFQHVLAQGHIVLILDGFDEMAARITPQVTARNFHELARCVQGRAKVLLTCRTHYFKSRTEEEEVILGQKEDYGSETARDLYWELISRKGFRIAYLRPFNLAQVEAYVVRARPEDAKQALAKIRSTYNLMELSQRPMLLEMIVKSIDKLTTSEINAATLYKVFTDTWVHRDQWRDVLSPEAKLSLLTALARSLWHDDSTSIHYSALGEYVRHELAAQIQDPQRFVEVESEIRTASFLTRDAAGNYGFAHKSYSEFFFARYVASQLKAENFDCLHTRRFSPEVVSFLKDLMDTQESEPALERIVCAAYRPLVSENALLCLYGFRRQALVRGLQHEELKVTLPTGVLLPGAQLEQVTLEGAELEGADLTGANLSGAILSKADLTNARLANAKLEKVDLSGAILNGAVLVGAQCAGANMSGAKMVATDLAGANMADALLLEVEHADTDFRSVNLGGAILPDTIASALRLEAYDKLARDGAWPYLESAADEQRAFIESIYPDILAAAQAAAWHYGGDVSDIVSQIVLSLLHSSKQREFSALPAKELQSKLYWQGTRIALNARNRDKRIAFSLDDKAAVKSELASMPHIEPSAVEEVYADEIKQALAKEIDTALPEKLKRVITKRYFQDKSLREIAADERMSLASAYRSLRKAEDILRERLQKLHPSI